MPISSSRMGSNRSQKGGITKAPKRPIKVKLVTGKKGRKKK